MKPDDRTMTLLTGIVLTIGVGTLAQNSEAIMSAFGAKTGTTAADDSFTVRAGKAQVLDVLANDTADEEIQDIRIVAAPACGTVQNSGGSLEYTDSGSCTGKLTFDYCIEVKGICENASVTLNVIGAPVAQEETPLVIAARPAPATPRPQSQPQISKAVTPDPAPAPEAVNDIRLAVLSALARPPIVGADADDEEEAAPVVRDRPVSPPGGFQPPIRAFENAEPAPETIAAPLRETPDDPSPDEYTLEIENIANLIPDVPAPQTASRSDNPQDEPAMTSVKHSAAPDFGVASTALIMLPSTQDRIGSRVGAASRTAEAAALRTDGIFVASLDEDQMLATPLAVNTAEVLDVPPLVTTTPQSETRTAALCPVSVDLSVTTGAMLNASIDASCNSGEIITVEHAGIRFAARIDARGKAQVQIPAVTEQAQVSVRFADGTERLAQAVVPDLDRYMRVAITWQGDVDLDLHALEFGANTSDRGHVWSQTPRSYRESRRFGGGYMTVLGLGAGNGPQAEVYTLPLYRRADSGLVEMSLSLVGDAACNEDLSMRAVRSDSRHAARIRELQFRVTDCDRRSEPVFIANALEDLRVASRR